MNLKHLLPLLVAPLCCWGEAPRDYKMVDLHNRLTTTMLDIGKTSFTFSVEWPLDTEFDYGRLYLMGKLDIKRRGWDFLEGLRIDPTQGKAIFEIRYTSLPEEYFDWTKEDLLKKKAFFAIRIPIDTGTLYGPDKGRYEEDDETDVFENWWKDDVGEGKEGESPSPHRVWLYLGILCAVFGVVLYFVRRKMKR